MRRLIVLLGSFLIAGLLGGVVPAPAVAVVRYVANTGVDGADCGPITSPCRSISRAIALAASGDRIVVGPGRYGDVDRDSHFGSPGDEAVASFCGGCLAITKVVTVESSAGAAATIIEIWNAAVVVAINATGAVFGKHDKGFTVKGPGTGIWAMADDVTVQGNHVTAGERGILVERDKGVPLPVDANDRLLENVITCPQGTGRETLGIEVVVSGVAVSGNVIRSCTDGITVDGNDTVISDNHVVDNVRGIVVSAGANTTIRRNVLAGHEQAAVYVGTFGTSDPTAVTLTSNNFADNGVFPDPTAGPNCAVVNFTPDLVNAERNFWGAASGPGPDPADRSCPTAGLIDTAPYLTRAVTITNQAGR
jgi:parallel beta-helix repeat protein